MQIYRSHQTGAVAGFSHGIGSLGFSEETPTTFRHLFWYSETNSLSVTFRSGINYHFFDVPVDVFMRALDSESIADWYRYEGLTEKYRYVRINPNETEDSNRNGEHCYTDSATGLISWD